MHDPGDWREGELLEHRPPRLPTILSALAVLFAALAALLAGAEVREQEPRPAPAPTPAATADAPEIPAGAAVDGPDADGQLDERITVDPAAAAQVEGALEAGQAELADPLREAQDTPATTTIPGPLAADEIPGCRTRFVGNSSSRGGARPRLIFLHQTVSRERGWSSQDALTALASRRSSGVSWHVLVGRSQGRCTYTVPLALKAWTQANANPYAVGIEVEAYGDEGRYVEGAGRRKLVSVVRHIARRFGIPLRRGAVDRASCRPIRSGLVEHSDAGACGGGHVDVTLAPADAATLIARAARERGQPRTERQRHRCGALAYHRRKLERGARRRDRVTVDGRTMTRGERIRFLRRKLREGGVAQRRYCAA